MTIHEHLPRIAKPELKLVGWTKATELVKVARRDPARHGKNEWAAHLAKPTIITTELNWV